MKMVCDTRHGRNITKVTVTAASCTTRPSSAIATRGLNGSINVAQHAIKTDGQMTTQPVVGETGWKSIPKPQLEIHADDVKCSHGATIGVADDEQMFYLQSRGIRQQEAAHRFYAFAAVS
ncbi:SufD family Fe-S cluster assembly protein [Salmonella enterica subsp. enterica]|nr:SufD family Fe-S cluster assembly protein [Salmonella enterica subsp. enterica]